MNKQDCIFYDVTSCKALKVMACGDCAFYKTREMQESSIRKAKERCERLGIEYNKACPKERETAGADEDTKEGVTDGE